MKSWQCQERECACNDCDVAEVCLDKGDVDECCHRCEAVIGCRSVCVIHFEQQGFS